MISVGRPPRSGIRPFMRTLLTLDCVCFRTAFPLVFSMHSNSGEGEWGCDSWRELAEESRPFVAARIPKKQKV